MTDDLVRRLEVEADRLRADDVRAAHAMDDARDRIEALEAAAKPLSEWFHLHYPVKWEHGGGLKLDRALGADR